LNESLSTRLSEKLCQILDIEKTFNQTPKANINKAIEFFQSWKIKPIETGGYDKAEVTIGGVDTRELEQKTMESKKQKGLYFIGEVVDVTGWLGGYNFQWAWSSGFVCGRAIGSNI
jgi:predicted Rossmann fold flavoprotein